MSCLISSSESAVLERFGKLVLRVLERALSIRQAAVLDPERDLPQLIDDALHARARAVLLEPVIDACAGPDRRAGRR